MVSEKILAKGGVVFGAAFDNAFNVVHCKIEDISDLERLRGSKYVQSDTKNTFSEVRTLLRHGKTVLYSGTPCQINGLLKFVGDRYTENLYTCDFVCHGVPSPKVWRMYLRSIEKRYGASAEHVFHRDKCRGWKTFSITLKLSRMGKTIKYSQILTFNKYLQAFLRNVILRPSCYTCKFKGIHRAADITMADFWGVRKICPTMNNDTGVSLVITHSSKGQNLFEKIKEKGIWEKVSIEDVAKINENLVKSPNEPSTRKLFFNNIDKLSFNELYRLYVKRGVIYEIKNRTKGYVKLLLHYLNY